MVTGSELDEFVLGLQNRLDALEEVPQGTEELGRCLRQNERGDKVRWLLRGFVSYIERRFAFMEGEGNN